MKKIKQKTKNEVYPDFILIISKFNVQKIVKVKLYFTLTIFWLCQNTTFGDDQSKFLFYFAYILIQFVK